MVHEGDSNPSYHLKGEHIYLLHLNECWRVITPLKSDGSLVWSESEADLSFLCSLQSSLYSDWTYTKKLYLNAKSHVWPSFLFSIGRKWRQQDWAQTMKWKKNTENSSCSIFVSLHFLYYCVATIKQTGAFVLPTKKYTEDEEKKILKCLPHIFSIWKCNTLWSLAWLS